MLQAFRVSGIPIRVDASWLLVFGLISWSLASGYFPRVMPDASVGAAWLHGIVAAALLFASVLLHELSHALVAIEHGVPVAGIRLHVFGGVSEMVAEPPTPQAEALIAGVGPLTSFVIAAVCYGMGRLVAGNPWMVALTGYLAAVNFIIALFNLVPGFPLDGGRLLRAMLWSWSGHFGWATRWATRAGSTFALVLVALGVLRAVGGELVGGLWFVLIGLFLHQAARSSLALAQIREQLEPLRAEDVMTPVPSTTDGSQPLAEAAADGEQVSGDEALLSPGAADAVAPQASAWEAFLKLGVSRRGRVPVVDERSVVGVITQRDIQRVVGVERRRADVARRAA